MYLVTTCTDRKRCAPIDKTSIRHLGAGSTSQRIARWVNRLERAPLSIVAARSLYAGESWAVACRHESLVDELLVISAGYGLVRADDPLKPYAATFSLGAPDSVGADIQECAAWWRVLSEWAGPGTTRTSLAERCETGRLIIAASWQYLIPLRREIEELPTDRVLVCSAGAPSGLLDAYRLPIEGRFRTVLGGSMMSLNVRMAARLVDVGGRDLTRPEAMRIVSDLQSVSGSLPKHSRQRLTDDEIRTRIVAALRREPTFSWTALHRSFRQEGLACEQRRFRQLFDEVMTSISDRIPRL